MRHILISCFIMAFITPAHADLLQPSKGTALPPSLTELGQEGMEIPDDFNLKSIQEVWNKKDAGVKAVKNYTYNPSQTYKLQLRQNMHTLIVLPDWEEAEIVSIGDNVTFRFTRFDDKYNKKNMVVVSGVMPGSDTDMRIVGTSGNVYNFYLRNDPVDSKNVPDLTVYIRDSKANKTKIVKESESKKTNSPVDLRGRFKKLDFADLSDLERNKADYLKSLPEGHDDIDLNYKITGDYEIAPRAVYDDKKGFTYLDFRNALPSDRLPVVYKVVDGIDALVNTQFKDGFLIIKTISKEGFTLRNGDKVVCIRKDV